MITAEPKYSEIDLKLIRSLAKFPIVQSIVDSIAANPKTVAYSQAGIGFSDFGSFFAKKFEAKSVLVVSPIWSHARCHAGFVDYECDATIVNIEKIHTVEKQRFDLVFASCVRGHDGQRFATLAEFAIDAKFAVVRCEYVRHFPRNPLVMVDGWKLAIVDDTCIRFHPAERPGIADRNAQGLNTAQRDA